MTDSIVETAAAPAESHDVHHPSDWEYVKIAAWLALFTAIEVGTYFVEDSAPRWALFTVLTVLMIVKFVIVGAQFMHLKYDTPMFRQVFIAGIVLAVVVYTIFLLAFDVFGLG